MVAVAQSVEHRIVIPVVAGSIPVSHPIFYIASRRSTPIKNISLINFYFRVPAKALKAKTKHLFYFLFLLI